MNNIDIIFALVRGALEGRSAEIGPLEAKRWWQLFRLAQQNHVAALVANALPSDTPREVLIPWLAEQQKAESWHRYQKEVQKEIVEAMKSHGIETLVLKGTHLAQYYPQPEQREFGDLDLYFYDRHDEADRVAQEVLGVEVNAEAHHHTRYAYRGVTVESHYDFVNRHYPPSNRRYEKMLKELAPSPTFEVLFLLRHMAGHFAANRITLRDLVDWTLTCRALADKADWSLVDNVVEQYGMTSFVKTLNAIAAIRFTTQSLGHPATLDRMEHDIVYGSFDDCDDERLGRLGWKLRRWRALRWKRRMVYSDSDLSLWIASLTSHAAKPRSILHKM